MLRNWLETDHWREILDTMRQNRLRTALTAAGVFWGIFMLIVMLGMGHGLQNSAGASMDGHATNAVFMWGRRTSTPHRGFQPGRRVRFNNEDIVAIRDTVDEVEHICPRLQQGGWRGGGDLVTRGDRSGHFGITGDVPDLIRVQPLDLVAGRFLNPIDQAQRRKVVVIGTGARRQLFATGEEAIGSEVQVRASSFVVVGVVEPRATGDRGEEMANTVFMPLSTFQAVYNRGDRIDWFLMTAVPEAPGNEVEARVKKLLRTRHHVAPDDPDGIGSFSLAEEFRKVQVLFVGIRLLIWFVGTMTLIAGVIGVSNIMLIAVKERTKEIGIRRAVGAAPRSIIGMIIQESVVLTSLAGYAGLVTGVAVLEAVAVVVGQGGDFFSAPGVDLTIALTATGILILFGVLAGIMPARAALRINPAEAVRME